MQRLQRLVSGFGVFLAIASLLATAIHPIVAFAMEPPLFPMSWLIDLQLRFRGSYGLTTTWAMGFFHELSLLLILIVVGMGAARVIKALFFPTQVNPEDGYERLEQHSRMKVSFVGAGALVLSDLFYYAAFAAPSVLEPAGYLSLLALVLAPFVAVFGLVFFLDGILPATSSEGQVESQSLVYDERGNVVTSRISSAGQTYHISATSHDALPNAARFRVDTMAISGRVLSLSKKRIGYRG